MWRAATRREADRVAWRVVFGVWATQGTDQGASVADCGFDKPLEREGHAHSGVEGVCAERVSRDEQAPPAVTARAPDGAQATTSIALTCLCIPATCSLPGRN